MLRLPGRYWADAGQPSSDQYLPDPVKFVWKFKIALNGERGKYISLLESYDRAILFVLIFPITSWEQTAQHFGGNNHLI